MPQTYDYLIAPKASFDATADAVRALNGTNSAITWGQDGFAEAIGNERRYGSNDIASRNYTGNITLTSAATIQNYAFASSAITGISSETVTRAREYCFSGCTSLTSVNLPNADAAGDGDAVGWFDGCTSLTTLNLPNASNMWNYMYRNCTSLTTIVLPALRQLGRPNSFTGDTALKTIDLGGKNKSTPNSFANNWFQNLTSFDTLILRYSTLVGLGNVGAFTGTVFASGGTGGTIYIPKTYYDALGTGTSSDYQVATNWATVYGYGTITWAQIEGSQYENYYADGTAIPTT